MSPKPGNILHVNSGYQTFFNCDFFLVFPYFHLQDLAISLSLSPITTECRLLPLLPHRQHLCVFPFFMKLCSSVHAGRKGSAKSLINFEIKNINN